MRHAITGLLFAAAAILGFNLTMGHVPAWALCLFAAAMLLPTANGWLQRRLPAADRIR